MFEALLGRKKTGFVLALSGGGGRGLAHLGVLEELELQNLRPDAIVGTSIGALFGAMYALNPDAKAVRERVLEFLGSGTFQHINLPVAHDVDVDEVDESWLSRLTNMARQSVLYVRALTGISVSDTGALQEVAGVFCGSGSFDTVQIPLYITAVRFPGGECHIFSQGNLCQALIASMAVPAVFDPVEIDGARYVDGGLASEVPAMEARSVATETQLVVAVNTGVRPDPGHEPSNVIAMLDWAAQVKALYLRRYEKAHADILIEPLVGYTQWHDFSNPEQEIQRGREAALEKIPELKSRLQSL